MMTCAVCGKSSNDTLLYEGIVDGAVRSICSNCAKNEKITIIKKPTKEQIEASQKRQSVKELMEKLSSPQSRIMTKDSVLAHKSLAKLNFPAMKQEHSDLVPNYDWILKQARRHRKLSTTQLAEMTGIDRAQLEALESGQIFSGFEKVVQRLEKVLQIKIIKNFEPIAKITRTPEQNQDIQKKILSEVKDNIKKEKKGFFSMFKRNDEAHIQQEEIKHDTIDIEEIKAQKNEEKTKKLEKLQREIDNEEIDFSDRKRLDNIKLHELAEMKKRREGKK